MFLYNNSHLIN